MNNNISEMCKMMYGNSWYESISKERSKLQWYMYSTIKLAYGLDHVHREQGQSLPRLIVNWGEYFFSQDSSEGRAVKNSRIQVVI